MQYLTGKTVENIEDLLPQINKSYLDNEIDNCKFKVHKLRGGASVFGAIKLSESFKYLETRIHSNDSILVIQESIMASSIIANKTIELLKNRYML